MDFKKSKVLLTSSTGTYGWALEALQAGLRVTRVSWNNKQVYLFLATVSSPGELVGEGVPEFSPASRDVYPFIGMIDEVGGIFVGWVPSLLDQLASDWISV